MTQMPNAYLKFINHIIHLLLSESTEFIFLILETKITGRKHTILSFTILVPLQMQVFIDPAYITLTWIRISLWFSQEVNLQLSLDYMLDSTWSLRAIDRFYFSHKEGTMGEDSYQVVNPFCPGLQMVHIF